MSTDTELEPAYAFSIFTASRPVLKEITELTKEDFIFQKTLPWCFVKKTQEKLERLSRPWHYGRSFEWIELLEEKLKNPNLNKSEREKIQRDILELKEEGRRPVREFNEKLDRLSKAVELEVSAFEEWIKNDPVGIAATAQDNAFDAWVESERKRQEDERRQSARNEKMERMKRELEDSIGRELITLNLDHPDIDKVAAEAFLDWHEARFGDGPEIFISNAILSGDSGTGKTRALAQAAIRYIMQEEYACLEWITGYEFAELIGDLATENRSEANVRLQEITNTQILYFDDLGSANFTPARTSRFFRLIDERHRHHRATLFTTNYSTAQLKRLFGKTGESKDDAVRILRRIIGTQAEPLARFFHFKRPEGGKIIAA